MSTETKTERTETWAIIGGVGADSTVPDDPTAVDATVYLHEGAYDVTMRVDDYSGELGTWGSLDHWAEPSLVELLEARDDRDELIVEIVAAVIEAAAEARA